MCEDSSSLYWLSSADESSAVNGATPLIITVAVFRQNGGEVLWDLLPLTAEILDGVTVRHQRDGAITAKVHEKTDLKKVVDNISKVIRTPVAKKTSLVVFCQNGEIAEKFLDVLRRDEALKLST